MQKGNAIQLALSLVRRWAKDAASKWELATILFLAEKRHALRYGRPILSARTPEIEWGGLQTDSSALELEYFSNSDLDCLEWACTRFSRDREGTLEKARSCPEHGAYLDRILPPPSKIRLLFADEMLFDTSGWPEAGADLADCMRTSFIETKNVAQSPGE